VRTYREHDEQISPRRKRGCGSELSHRQPKRRRLKRRRRRSQGYGSRVNPVNHEPGIASQNGGALKKKKKKTGGGQGVLTPNRPRLTRNAAIESRRRPPPPPPPPPPSTYIYSRDLLLGSQSHSRISSLCGCARVPFVYKPSVNMHRGKGAEIP